MNIYKKKIGPYKLLQPPRQWSRPHEPTSIMANAQRKVIYRFGIHSRYRGYKYSPNRF